MSGALQKLSMLRHSRGFGVHSPLAFDLITKVMRDKPQYYADKNLNAFYGDSRQRRIARIILRLIAYFEPVSVSCPDIYAKVVESADTRIKRFAEGSPAEMTIQRENDILKLQYGLEQPGYGPLVLTNCKDLHIKIYRRGLSPVHINTKL